MNWSRPFAGTSRSKGRPADIGAATPSRFRVEALEPRLLLSGDPLDLASEALQAPLLPEPVVVVEADASQAGSTATPTIDWGADTAGTDQADPSDGVSETPVPGPVETSEPALAADIATTAETVVQVSTMTVTPVTDALGATAGPLPIR